MSTEDPKLKFDTMDSHQVDGYHARAKAWPMIWLQMKETELMSIRVKYNQHCYGFDIEQYSERQQTVLMCIEAVSHINVVTFRGQREKMAGRSSHRFPPAPLLSRLTSLSLGSSHVLMRARV